MVEIASIKGERVRFHSHSTSVCGFDEKTI